MLARCKVEPAPFRRAGAQAPRLHQWRASRGLRVANNYIVKSTVAAALSTASKPSQGVSATLDAQKRAMSRPIELGDGS